ncbi:MAG: class I SAM-dependent methyltransferase [Pseudomonadales bacterium]|nr:class I SAM-dependent methyltransferase [Pseudomonadales bacterium]
MNKSRPDDTYYQGERRELLPYIPMLGDRLLDVGCGEGGFAAMLKRERGYQEIWGMEYDEKSAAVASSLLNRVIPGDASNALGALPDDYFNLICLNDVIEHLIWPEAFLAGLKQKLTQDARIFCSIPNLRQYRLLWNLLQSQDFEYTDSGLLDRTHLRFFTRKTMLTLLDRAGFEPTSVIGWGTTKSWKFKILNALTLWRGNDMMHSHFFILAKAKQMP